jgi:hypothetical protein
MNDSLKRRDFIKSTSVLGASIAISNSASAFFNDADDIEIRNDYFVVSFDKKKKTINVLRSNNILLVTDGAICVNSNLGKHFIAANNYKHSFSSKTFSDNLGAGKRLIILSKDADKKLDVETSISLYDALQGFTIEVFCSNVSKQNILIKSIEPLRVVKNEGGSLNMPGVSKCITNGAMYYNTGAIHEFGTSYEITSDLKQVKPVNTSITSPNETVNSWWNAGLFNDYNKEGFVLGYSGNKFSLGQLLISKTAADEISFLAESVYYPEVTLKPATTISSDCFIMNIAADIYKALEDYAGAVGKINNARTASIINGWCSWFYTLSHVSEDELMKNTAFASKHLKQYGLEYIQIDEGYQRWHGDWEGNERFPHGMKWLATKIKEHGFKAGIWISPYVISEPTEVFKKHPEWLLKNADGSLKRVGNWEEPPPYENPKRYGLDITHPGAVQWLHNLIDTIANDWGFEMIKIDFIAWTIFAADHFYNPSYSSAQVYRKGMEIMRNAAGDNCHILECGPGAITVGLIDSMRIEADVYYGFRKIAWETYFTHPACSASAAGKRYYFHKRTRINDVDHICMDILNNQQSEAAATLIALSGGNLVSGDRLIQLDPYKLAILQKITPSFGEAAIPVDLFDEEIQSVFALKIKKQFAEWTVVGFFNPSLTTTAEKKFSLERLWLNPNKIYIAFDFWKKQFIGEISNEIKTTIAPGSVNLFSLHEKTGRPQFISTDRHVVQGGIETDNVSWNENTQTLSGTSAGPLNSLHNVCVYIPESHEWAWGGHILFHDYDDYSLRSVDENIVQVTLRFEKSEKVNWEINTKQFFE